MKIILSCVFLVIAAHYKYNMVMFAIIKRIKKPTQKQDFFTPSGEPVSPYRKFPVSRNAKSFRQFSSLNIRRANELAQEKLLIIRPRVEIKVELRKTFRNDGKVSSRTWHLASIMEGNVGNPIIREAFWQKIEDRLQAFKLSLGEKERIRKKIENDVPRMTTKSRGQR